MNILVVHQNFPGQFKHLIPALIGRGHTVSGLGLRNPSEFAENGVHYTQYQLGRDHTPNQHPWLIDFEAKVIRGTACMEAALNMKAAGYSPEIILAHYGWGESLFLKEVWPDARLLAYCEFFYSSFGLDTGFDPEFMHEDPMDACRILLKNSNNLLNMQITDAAICPTEWQASTFPKHHRDKMSVIHDGIDTDIAKPDDAAFLVLNETLKITKKDKVITFINRNLEPLRGFHIFMRSLPKILHDDTEAVVLIIGGDERGYGVVAEEGKSWKSMLIEELAPIMQPSDWKRVFFLGKLPYEYYLTVLRVSSVHVYLTYPFVLGWSLLEAMSTGCAIVGSNTQPVSEVLEDGKNGLLVNFFDQTELAAKVLKLLNDRCLALQLGERARQLILEKYDLRKVCLPKQLEWIESTTEKP